MIALLLMSRIKYSARGYCTDIARRNAIITFRKVCCESNFGQVGIDINTINYRVILSVLDQRKCEYLKDYSLDFEHACMTTYLAS